MKKSDFKLPTSRPTMFVCESPEHFPGNPYARYTHKDYTLPTTRTKPRPVPAFLCEDCFQNLEPGEEDKFPRTPVEEEL